jgi:SAM-dependent methyltransferase
MFEANSSRILLAGQQLSCEAEMHGPTPWMPGDDNAPRKHAPATLRNREPIAQVLQQELPAAGKVLEVASGSGEHCAFFAERFPGHLWQPTDPDPGALGSIGNWCAGLDNVMRPLALDAASPDWPVEAADAVLCINMAHISPWEATLGLIAGAQRLLAQGAPLILYGPWRRAGVPTAPSNEAFDASLKARDPRWGLRVVEDFDAAADARGFARTRLVEMPANNLMLVYRR